jgi:hypothetical protein
MEDSYHNDQEESESDYASDEYEKDGFVVDDTDVCEYEDGCSVEMDNDQCRVCHQGGELLVCDGGEHAEGCHRSFHVTCVGLIAVPEGDWICQHCSFALGLDSTDGHGYEFPPQNFNHHVRDGNSSLHRRKRNANNDWSLDSEEEEEQNSVVVQRPKQYRKLKRKVITESDEEVT